MAQSHPWQDNKMGYALVSPTPCKIRKGGGMDHRIRFSHGGAGSEHQTTRAIMTSMWRELYYKSESRKGHIWKDVLQVIGALKEAATQHIEI